MKQTAFDKLQGAQRRIDALQDQLRDAQLRETQLRAALAPFARAGSEIPADWADNAQAIKWKAGKHPWFMTVGDFRRAAQAAPEIAEAWSDF